MTEEKKTKGKAWRMREWGRAQYRNRQAKLRMDGESSKTEASKRMLRVQGSEVRKESGGLYRYLWRQYRAYDSIVSYLRT